MIALGDVALVVQDLAGLGQWSDVKAFAKWYFDAGMPFMPPFDGRVVATDDATSAIVFGHGQFQVEMYLIHKQEKVRRHSHPNIRELITVNFGGGSEGRQHPNAFVNAMWGMGQPVLRGGQIHESSDLQREANAEGYVLLTFEWWADGVKPTSAALNWRGFVAGTRHLECLLEEHPNAYVYGDFVDVTRQQGQGPLGVPAEYMKEEKMIEFQVLSRNADGSLRVEYPVYQVSDIEVPRDATGNELRGADLYRYLREQVDRLNGDVVPIPLDAQINEELGLNNLEPLVLEEVASSAPFDPVVNHV